MVFFQSIPRVFYLVGDSLHFGDEVLHDAAKTIT